jgi:hypothetical protein
VLGVLVALDSPLQQSLQLVLMGQTADLRTSGFLEMSSLQLAAGKLDRQWLLSLQQSIVLLLGEPWQ